MVDTVIQIAKIMAIVAVSAVFLVAINSLIGLLASWVSTTFIGEFFSMISMYLPFNGSVVFNSILTVCIGIFSFLIANKIFNLTSWSINSSIFAIILLFFIFMIIEIISYYIMRYRNIRYGNIIGLGIIIVMYIIFGYLTYYPIEIDLFYDDSKNVYGIPK